MNHIENAMGLLDAAFAYLNILHPTEVEKKKHGKLLQHLWPIGGQKQA